MNPASSAAQSGGEGGPAAADLVGVRASEGRQGGGRPGVSSSAFLSARPRPSRKGLAESRRAELMTAARAGEPFDPRVGLPASEPRDLKRRTTWFVLAREYIEQRWDRTSGNTRRSLTDASATITPAIVESGAVHRSPRVL
ncbi:hypothetical protein GCM10022384_57200 [Streptomyces marokkonensis]|uniref:Uncharacterized protein n=1 Tax=Streptomyces marokkonensis TaxID=324855 RepID=A0ABP7RVX6_9ACTN